MDWKKFGCAVRQKRGKRGYREICKDIGVSPATISRFENNNSKSKEQDPDFPKLLTWLGMSEAEIDAIELPPEVSDQDRTAPICLECKTPLVNVEPKDWKETQAVERMKFYEDDAEMVVVDETFTVHGMVGYCPKCKRQRTQDWYSGLWW